MKHQQISSNSKGKEVARVAKRILTRLERRRGKKLDDAPTRRRYRGYT